MRAAHLQSQIRARATTTSIPVSGTVPNKELSFEAQKKGVTISLSGSNPKPTVSASRYLVPSLRAPRKSGCGLRCNAISPYARVKKRPQAMSTTISGFSPGDIAVLLWPWIDPTTPYLLMYIVGKPITLCCGVCSPTE